MLGFSAHIYFHVSTDISLVHNMEAGFSHFAAVLGCPHCNTLEKEQTPAPLTPLHSYKHKNQTADVKGRFCEFATCQEKKV